MEEKYHKSDVEKDHISRRGITCSSRSGTSQAKYSYTITQDNCTAMSTTTKSYYCYCLRKMPLGVTVTLLPGTYNDRYCSNTFIL